jgi:hypothetical protein
MEHKQMTLNYQIIGLSNHKTVIKKTHRMSGTGAD